jgi:hypothetical protein
MARAPRRLPPSILQERRRLQTAHGNDAFAFLDELQRCLLGHVREVVDVELALHIVRRGRAGTCDLQLEPALAAQRATLSIRKDSLVPKSKEALHAGLRVRQGTVGAAKGLTEYVFVKLAQFRPLVTIRAG